MRLLACLLALGIGALSVGGVEAQEKEKEKPKKPDPYAGLFAFPKVKGKDVITLTDKQKDEIADLRREFVPKLEAVDKKRAEILTPEILKKLAAIDKERGALVGEIIKRRIGVLTDEQKEALKIKKKDKPKDKDKE